MSTMTRDEIAERLVVMKSQAWPHCSAERLRMAIDPPETWLSLIERDATVTEIDRYLHHFLAPSEIDEKNEVVKNDCPCCQTRGWFGWGIRWGSGSCRCGWPATLYHRIVDTRADPDLLCEFTMNGERRCEARRGDHTGDDLRCPVQSAEPFVDHYQPPLIVGFTLLLWAHPYTVSLTKRRKR